MDGVVMTKQIGEGILLSILAVPALLKVGDIGTDPSIHDVEMLLEGTTSSDTPGLDRLESSSLPGTGAVPFKR
jgi:hypothetical protein